MPKFRNPLKASRYIQLSLAGGNAPDVSPAGTARLYYDPTSNTVKWSLNGGAAQTAGGFLTGTTTWDPGSLNDGATETKAVTVTGAALGDCVVVSFSLDIQGMLLTGYVSATNTVTAVLQNETGGTLDLASGTLKARVLK